MTRRCACSQHTINHRRRSRTAPRSVGNYFIEIAPAATRARPGRDRGATGASAPPQSVCAALTGGESTLLRGAWATGRPARLEPLEAVNLNSTPAPVSGVARVPAASTILEIRTSHEQIDGSFHGAHVLCLLHKRRLSVYNYDLHCSKHTSRRPQADPPVPTPSSVIESST